MPHPIHEIKDNQYIDVPTQAPYQLGGEQMSREALQEAVRAGHKAVASRVMGHDPALAMQFNIGTHLIEQGDEGFFWIKDKVTDQPYQTLRDIDTLLSNTEQILKENPRLLM